MAQVKFARPADELSCIIGNLFVGLEPSCDYQCKNALVIGGMTHNHRYGRLIVKSDHCIFDGEVEDLEAVLNGRCPERRCKNG